MQYLKAGETASDITLPDAGSGALVRLSEVVGRGGWTLLVWSKVTCPTCRLAAPFIERIHAKLPGDARSRVLMVTQDPPEDVPAFRAESGCPTVPMLCEAEPYRDADAYGITNVPTLFLLDAQLRVAWSGMGFSRDDLQELLGRLGGEGSLFREEELETVPPQKPG